MSTKRWLGLLMVVLVASPEALGAGQRGQREGGRQGGQAQVRPSKRLRANERGDGAVLPVTGLTAASGEQLVQELRQLQQAEYSCRRDELVKEEEGDCPTCGEPLERVLVPALRDVAASAEKGTLQFQVNPGIRLRLESLKGLLAAKSVRLDYAKLQVFGPAALVVRGAPAEDEAVQKILAALRQAGAPAAGGAWTAGTELLVPLGSGRIPWSKASEIVPGAVSGAYVADVAWGARPPAQRQ